MTTIEKLLIDLLQIPSPTGEEENIANFIITQLEGFKITKQHIAPKRFNVVATKGSPLDWLIAHMDTVPGNLPVKITPQNMYGRGACDNKQSIAGAIMAGRELDSIGLLFTVGEEHDFCGAKKAQPLLKNSRVVIVQEPTNFQIVTGQRGVVTFDIATTGKEQHSGQPNIQSAVHSLVQILHNLARQEWTQFNVGTIQGGTAENMVASTAHARIVVRPKSIAEHQKIMGYLKQIPAQITVTNSFPPFEYDLGFPSHIGDGFAETAFFKNSLKFGAGDVQFAHSNDEHIARTDLNVLPEKLRESLRTAVASQEKTG